MEQLWEPLEEGLLHTPILQLAVVALEQRAELVRVRVGVVDVGGVEGEGPGEFEMALIGFGEVGGREVLRVLLDEAVAEGGPGEEVDGDRMLGGALGRAGDVSF